MREQDAQISDEDIAKHVRWPQNLSINEIRNRLRKSKRFIDFDNTLVLYRRSKFPILRNPFCGKPLGEFLAEKPFIVQTWHGGIMPVALFDLGERQKLNDMDREYFSLIFQENLLPAPLLICTPPGLVMKVPTGVSPHRHDVDGTRFYKNLHALSIKQNVEIYDDEPNHIYAPGCKIISDF